MARRALVLLEGHRSIGLLYVKAAQRLGLHPITLSSDLTQYGYLAAEGVEAIRVDTDNLDTLIHECSRLRTTYDIAGITGFAGDDESVYVMVGKLSQHFNLPGPNPASIEGCCDKFTQRQLLAEAGVPVPAYRLAEDAANVESAARDIGLPVILKPRIGSGSIGVLLSRTVDELAEHTTYLLSGKHTWRSSPRILVEEFAQGQHYSADTMGSEVVAISATNFDRPPHFVVLESTFPAVLTDEEYKRVADLSLSCLRALGLGWGPTNIEFRWTKRGPVVIEVNPRIPGGTIPRLIHLAYGIDLVTEHIKAVIGEEWDLRRSHSHTATARMLNADRDGILDWTDGDSRAAAIPGVVEVKFYVEPRTPIVRKGDYRDTIGHVIAASASRAQTDAILQQAVDLIGWSIAPIPPLGERKQSSGTHLPAPSTYSDSRPHTAVMKFIEGTRVVSEAELQASSITRYHVTKFYREQITNSGYYDQLKYIVEPSLKEFDSLGQLDTSGEHDNTIVPGFQHKYAQTGLLLVTDRCASYCRYCLRKRIVGKDSDEIAADFAQIAQYICGHSEMTNVLLSGGDPFMLSTAKLGKILDHLLPIPHLNSIRFGTKALAYQPDRFEDPALTTLFQRIHDAGKTAVVVTHFDHIGEISVNAERNIRSLRAQGVQFLNQTVLLANVNDDPEILAATFARCHQTGVRPYYLFQARPVRGASHFQVSLRRGIEIARSINQRLSGIQKTFKYAMSHYTGKIEILDLGADGRVYMRYHQSKTPEMIGKVFSRLHLEGACWLDDLPEG